MKKVMLVLTVVFFLLGLTACGGGKYGDVKDVMNEMMSAQDKFAASCENLSSADDAVAALDNFTTVMETIAPKMKAMLEKYSEIKDANPPEELKPLSEKMAESSKKMQAAMQKMQAYQQDPKVQAAMMKLFGAMAKMGPQ